MIIPHKSEAQLGYHYNGRDGNLHGNSFTTFVMIKDVTHEKMLSMFNQYQILGNKQGKEK